MTSTGNPGAKRPECRLIYKSDTSWDLLSNEALKRLAESSASNNEKVRITGLLILSGEHFLQVLEGSAKAVNALYRKIIDDKRHANVTLISYEQVAERRFPDWSMHVVDLHELPLEHREILASKYDDEDGYVRVPDDSPTAFSLLLDARAYCVPEREREVSAG